MKNQDIYYIIFRYQGGGGYSSRNFEELAQAVKYADREFNNSKMAYYTIYTESSPKRPYSDIAVFKGNQEEFKKKQRGNFSTKRNSVENVER